jgi:hypothetical protein
MVMRSSPLTSATAGESSMRTIERKGLPVLFIAMEYPPVNTTGVFRSLKFTKYLSEYGVIPIVLTLEASDASEIFSAKVDSALSSDVPENLNIIRIPCASRPARRMPRLRNFIRIYFSLEDDIARRWRREIWRRIPDLIEQYQPEVVYVSLPPFSAGRLAVAIAHRFRLPLIVDMRDGWSSWRVGPFGSWLHYRMVVRRERAIFEAATTVVTVTSQLATVFAHTHENIPKSKIQVITNGFDNELQLPAVIDVPLRASDSTIVIGYVGSFYYEPEQHRAHFTPWWRKRFHRKLQYSAVKEDWLYRSPFFFFRALNRLFERKPEFRDRVKFEAIGANAPWLTAMAAEFDLEGNCAFHPRSSYARVVQFQERCDSFLCTSVKVPDGEDYAIASKTFDYLRYGKPIVGFVTGGAQREFLMESGLGLITDPDDTEAGSRVLEQLVEGDFRLTPNATFLARFHRRELAGELAAIVKKAAV